MPYPLPEDNNNDDDYYADYSGQSAYVPTEDSESASQVVDKELVRYITVQSPVEVSALFKKYAFKTFYHPYVCTMIKQLNRYGIEGLLNPKTDTEAGADLLRQNGPATPFSFEDTYFPNTAIVSTPFPQEGFDFDYDGPYGNYNWELFFHGPLLIAGKLNQNQKFEEAQKWLHYLFDPTQTEGDAPARYWKVKPFFEQESTESSDAFQDIIDKLSSESQSFNRQLDQWMKTPFQPHVVARLRIVAYMKSVVMKYLDNLIQWGDSLFRRDTIESINEATQLYILASQILGDKPVSIDKEDFTASTVNDVLNNSGSFIDRLVDLESELGSIDTGEDVDLGDGLNSLSSILYFCTLPNDKLLGYWDTVADRLFKIRHCMNIEGVTRSLALFEPPIDPALLVKASAAGLDIGSVLNGLSGANMPHYRFRVLIQKAVELCNDVKGLGQSLLAALEKSDAEELSLLRSSQEVNLLKAIRQIKEQAIEENNENLASLQNAQELSEIRREYYGSREFMNSSEKKQLEKMERAMQFQIASQATSALAGALAIIPNFQAGVAGLAASPFTTAEFGGQQFYNGLKAASEVLGALSTIENHNASKAGIKGGYERRKDDWELQTELAEKEIEQITRQIAGAEIRVAVSERELVNHDMQIEQSTEVEDFMKNKYTNRDLYNWMITQTSAIYFQSYQLAFDVARMAEQAYGYELAVENTSFVNYGHWDSLKKGLLAGERLQADLRRMEVAYLEQNKREYELTKHIPLSMLSAGQLINLRENGSCDIQVPEVLFDMDHPGQYLRRIKSVRLTIPCVTGPYTNVNAKLTLLTNRYRKTTNISDGYSYVAGANDDDFKNNVAGIQSIATSGGQNDAGVFDLNFQDERYLPFEGAGAVSTWRLELSSDFRQFDYDTISDVILHMSYTAREGGQILKQEANNQIEEGLKELIADMSATGKELEKAISLKTHFPNTLYQLLQTTDTGIQSGTFEIRQEHFPHFLNKEGLELVFSDTIHLMLKLRDGSIINATTLNFALRNATASVGSGSFAAANAPDLPLPYLDLTSVSGSPVDTWTLEGSGSGLNSENVEDIYMVFNYTIAD